METDPLFLMPCKQAHDHYDHSDQKDNDGNTVHAVHQEDIGIARLIWVALFQEQILLDLVPDAFLPARRVRVPLHD